MKNDVNAVPSFVQSLGILFDLCKLSHTQERLIQTQLEPWYKHLPPDTPRDAKQLHRVTVQSAQLPSKPSPEPYLTEVLFGEQVEVWLRDNELWIGQHLYIDATQPESSSIVICPTILTGDIENNEEDTENRTASSWISWTVALTELQRVAGWLPLHAACVMHQNRAIALTAPSGTGKSTATLRLQAEHFDMLTEDQLFWHAETDTLAGLDRYIHAYADTLQRYAPELWLEFKDEPRNHKGKYCIPLDVSPKSLPSLQHIALLDTETKQLSIPQKVQTLWTATGRPLTPRAKHNTQEAINRLLPLLLDATVHRDQVVETVNTLFMAQKPEPTI